MSRRVLRQLRRARRVGRWQDRIRVLEAITQECAWHGEPLPCAVCAMARQLETLAAVFASTLQPIAHFMKMGMVR